MPSGSLSISMMVDRKLVRAVQSENFRQEMAMHLKARLNSGDVMVQDFAVISFIAVIRD